MNPQQPPGPPVSCREQGQARAVLCPQGAHPALSSQQQKVAVTSEVPRELQKPPGDGNLEGRERSGSSL